MRSSLASAVCPLLCSKERLKRVARMLGSDLSRVVPRLPVGYSILHPADVGDPFVLAWRLTYSQP